MFEQTVVCEDLFTMKIGFSRNVNNGMFVTRTECPVT